MKSTALIFVVSFLAVEFGTVLKTARWSALGPCRKKGGDSWTLQMMGLGPCTSLGLDITFHCLYSAQGNLTRS